MTETLIKRTANAIKQSPREIFSWQLIYCVLIIAFAGVAKGIDEGNIASVVVMSSFRKEFGWTQLSKTAEANVKGWVISIATPVSLVKHAPTGIWALCMPPAL